MNFVEFVGKYKGILFYNDAISTTPESTIEAIKVFNSKLGTIILGGQDRGYKFSELAKYIYNTKVDNVVLFSGTGERIWREIKKVYKNKQAKLPNKILTKDMEKVVKFSYLSTPKGKACLLSTASPSYNIFKNFEEKGDLFKKYIKIHKNK